MFIDTPSKKRIIFSFIAYFPIISLLAGAPIPLPSLFEPTQGQIAMLNGINLSISIIGAIIGVGFYLRKKSKDELDAQNKKIDKLEDMINEKSDWLYNEMKGMETRICNGLDYKAKNIENIIEAKTKSAKDLEDERVDNLIQRIKRLEASGR